MAMSPGNSWPVYAKIWQELGKMEWARIVAVINI